MNGVERNRSFHFLVTCEHASRAVPRRWAKCLRGAAAALRGHRGWDRGARELALVLARGLRARLLSTTATRLLVDANRSLGHRALFSRWTASLPTAERQALVARHWIPYRRRVQAAVGAAPADGTVVHLSAHSFTPVLAGVVRRTDVGLLYDPHRKPERALCRAWRAALRRRRPDLVVHRNAPYRGCADGLTTHLRRVFPARRYLGIEIEVNQRRVADRAAWVRLQADIAAALRQALPARRAARPTRRSARAP